jgi:uncharacterized protein YdcH (DUF465 family)
MSDGAMKDEVMRYQQLVAEYEALDSQIDAWLASNRDGLDKMSVQDKAHYRELARRRDEVLNEMRALEQELLGDDEG